MNELLKKPYTRVYMPGTRGYTAYIVEFIGCVVEGKTLQEVKFELEVAADIWIENHIKNRLPIPEPNCKIKK